MEIKFNLPKEIHIMNDPDKGNVIIATDNENILLFYLVYIQSKHDSNIYCAFTVEMTDKFNINKLLYLDNLLNRYNLNVTASYASSNNVYVFLKDKGYSYS